MEIRRGLSHPSRTVTEMDNGVGLEEVLQAQAALRDVCDRFDPFLLPVADAPAAFMAFAEMERLAAGGRIRVAVRVKESEAARRDGERTTEEWMAERTGSTTADAKRDLTTSGQLVGLDGADAAVRQGALSPDQAAAVADAATADPDAEDGLLDCARRQPLSGLRDEARRTKAAADRDPERTHQRIHRNRFLRRWVDGEGAYNGALAGHGESTARRSMLRSIR